MKRTALVVAADSTMRLLLESTLNPQHWWVAQVSSVAGAARIVAAVNVDFLLIDLTHLGKQDVLQLCRLTRKVLGREQTRIIAFVNAMEIAKIGNDLRRQVDALFPKPYSPCALLDWIYDTFHKNEHLPPGSSSGVA